MPPSKAGKWKDAARLGAAGQAPGHTELSGCLPQAWLGRWGGVSVRATCVHLCVSLPSVHPPSRGGLKPAHATDAQWRRWLPGLCAHSQTRKGEAQPGSSWRVARETLRARPHHPTPRRDGQLWEGGERLLFPLTGLFPGASTHPNTVPGHPVRTDGRAPGPDAEPSGRGRPCPSRGLCVHRVHSHEPSPSPGAQSSHPKLNTLCTGGSSNGQRQPHGETRPT